MRTEPSCSCGAELDGGIVGRALSSPLFIHEREEPATGDKLITLMKKVCCQLSPFSHTQVRETRIRTQFVPKTKIKSRHGERKDQDSP